MQEEKGKTSAPRQAGIATLHMPDGTTVELPVLLDSNGDKFVDIRKLQPRWVDRGEGAWHLVRAAAARVARRPPPLPPHPLCCASETSRVAPSPDPPAAAAPACARLTLALAPPPPASPASLSSTATRGYCCTAGEPREGCRLARAAALPALSMLQRAPIRRQQQVCAATAVRRPAPMMPQQASAPSGTEVTNRRFLTEAMLAANHMLPAH
jgi:hypothetical protein